MLIDRIQNLSARAESAGKTASEYADEFEFSLQNKIDQSGTLITQGVQSAVEGSVQELKGAVVTPVLNKARDIPTGLVDLTGGFVGSLGNDLGLPPYKNPLSKFASYNYVFSFAALSTTEVNFPDQTYRKSEPKNVILRSGGAGNSKVKTIYEQSAGSNVEYFIDDVEIETIISPNPKSRHTNAVGLRFKVLEPYSMGLFLQTVQIASLKAGFTNYLAAPFLLSVDFKGYDDRGNVVTAPNARRLFPLKLTNVTFNVDENGSNYDIEAIPWHEQAMADETQKSVTDTALKGRSIVELLQTGGESLATVLNTRELELQQSGNKKVADKYVILFPTKDSSEEEQLAGLQEDTDGATTESSTDPASGGTRELSDARKKEVYESITGVQNSQIPADFDTELSKILGIVVKRSEIAEAIRDYAEKPENINKIGRSKIVKSFLEGGDVPFAKGKFQEVEGKPGVFKRGNITVSEEGRNFTFTSGTRIQDMIEEVILISEYGRELYKQQPDATGMINWFRIEADCYAIPDKATEAQTGSIPKIYVYRVVPYKVHSSRVDAPGATAKGIDNLKRQAVKEYNYIYTGENDDVLNFDIEINTAFFSAIMGDMGQNNADSITGSAQSMASETPEEVPGQSDGSSDNLNGKSTTNTVHKTSTGGAGGGGINHPETQVARMFNDAILNSTVDLIKAEMQIWGDPYYIADSGMGNYNAGSTDLININKNGSMDYQSSEVDVQVNFRTPLDIGDNGWYQFPGGGSVPVQSFSGLYQVVYVNNRFSDGQFTQNLQMIRRRNQPTETNVEPNNQSGMMVEKGPEGEVSEKPNSTADSVGAVVAEGAGTSQQGLSAVDELLEGVDRTAAEVRAAASAAEQAVSGVVSQANSVISQAGQEIGRVTNNIIRRIT